MQESPPPHPTVARALADLVLAITGAVAERCVSADFHEKDNGVAVVTVRVAPVIGPAAVWLHTLAREWLS